MQYKSKSSIWVAIRYLAGLFVTIAFWLSPLSFGSFSYGMLLQNSEQESVGDVERDKASVETKANVWKPAEVKVLVLGCPHLWQSSSTPELKEAIVKVRAQLNEFAPDLVAVEWLHPSIDPKKTSNYSPLGDADTLSKLWGIKRKGLSESLDTTREKIAKGSADQLLNLRLDLGKRLYLNGESLNAAYQWWLASEHPTASELSRLTQDNFEGHELRIFGFEAAKARGLETITPFDYQGVDADWNEVYGELLNAVAEIGVLNAPNKNAEIVQTERDAFLDEMESDPVAWCQKYRSRPELLPFVKVVESQLAVRKEMQNEIEGNSFGEFGYMQSEVFEKSMKQLYYDQLWKLPYKGLGRQLVVNYERRNEKMADFVVADAKLQQASRILVVVGGGHKLFLEEIFARRGFEVLDSLR